MTHTTKTDCRLWFCTHCLAPPWLTRAARNNHLRMVHAQRPLATTGYRLMRRMEAVADAALADKQKLTQSRSFPLTVIATRVINRSTRRKERPNG